MNLTVAEVAELPLAAALFNGDDLIAGTPEWRGAAAGAVSYRVRSATLLVSSDDAAPACAELLGRLLGDIEHMAQALPHRQALRARMLAASLRVVAGRASGAVGTSTEVLEHACAGIAARTGLAVSVEDGESFSAIDPAVAALVLVQFASNAERHDHARWVSMRAAQHTFTVSWDGPAARGGATTARRRAERPRWGLGFARIAADSIGAAVYPPVAVGGRRAATLEVGLNRLALPVALVREGVVMKATRTWDEETGLLPGAPVPSSSGTARCAATAAAAAWGDRGRRRVVRTQRSPGHVGGDPSRWRARPGEGRARRHGPRARALGQRARARTLAHRRAGRCARLPAGERSPARPRCGVEPASA